MAKNESKNENKVKKHFFKDFKAELKRVIWPTPKQLVNNTVAVVTIVLITAVIVFATDSVFRVGNKYGINGLQKIVDEKFNVDEEETKSNSDTETKTESNATEENSEENKDTTEQNQEDASATETPAEGEQANPEQ